MAAAPSPPAGATVSPTPPAAPPPGYPNVFVTPYVPPRSRRRWIPVIVVVVAAAVILAALAASGDFHLGSSGNPADETYSQALGVAQSGASSAGGGPWTAVAAAALVSATTVSEPATNLTNATGVSGCTFHWIGGTPSHLSVAATPSSAAAGTSAFWEFVLKNVSNSLLVETVAQGSASALVDLSGGYCATAAGVLQPLTSSVVNSPTVIAAVDSVGGAAFLSAHANASELWGVIGGATFLTISTEPEWFVDYTSCSVTAAASQHGFVFNATVNGLSGTVTNHTSGAAICSITIPTTPTLVTPTAFAAALLRKAI
jgi:hypothetical protein